MKRKLYLVFKVVFISTLVIFIVACGEGSRKNYIVTAQATDVKSFDPIVGTDLETIKKFKQIYNQLFIFDNKMQPIPELAEGYEQTDPYTYRIYIKKNVKFHNGEILTAQDVKFSLDRMKNNLALNFLTSQVESVEIIDEYTVALKTYKPDVGLPSLLGHLSSAILSKKYMESVKNEYDNKPIGTGPFKFVSRVPGKEIVFSAFKDYFKGAPASDGVVIKIVPNEEERLKLLEEGKVNFVMSVTPKGVEELEKIGKFKIYEQPDFSMGFLMLNNRIKPFDKKEVRQAMAYAIDLNEISEKVYLGKIVLADSPVNPLINGYKSVKSYANKDNETAKQLLAQAGYPNGFRMKILTSDYLDADKVSLLIQKQLKEVGINVELEKASLQEVSTRVDKADYEATISSHVTPTGTADYALNSMFNTSSFGLAGNKTFYSNFVVDKLLNNARLSTDNNVRMEDYAKVQEIIQDEVPIIPIGTTKNNAVIDEHTEGFDLITASYRTFADIRLKK